MRCYNITLSYCIPPFNKIPAFKDGNSAVQPVGDGGDDTGLRESVERGALRVRESAVLALEFDA
jgi:hypothetical protein